MKFKKEDKVKIVRGSIGKGSIGKVKVIMEQYHYPYKVYFKKTEEHNHLWMWFGEDDLELIDEV
jgi:hypothetical protein